MRLCAGCFLVLLPLLGCAGGTSNTQSCTLTQTLAVLPATATANHTAAAPGNQVQFTSSIAPKASSATCPVPAIVALAYPTWTNPDPLDITISSAANSTNGTAVCNSSTSGPVTLTATLPPGAIATPTSISVQLTCQ